MTTENHFDLEFYSISAKESMLVPCTNISVERFGGRQVVLEKMTGFVLDCQCSPEGEAYSIKSAPSGKFSLVIETDDFGFSKKPKVTWTDEEDNTVLSFIVVKNSVRYNVTKEVAFFMKVCGMDQLTQENLEIIGKKFGFECTAILKEWHFDNGNETFVVRFEEAIDGSYRSAHIHGYNIRPDTYQHQQQKIMVDGPDSYRSFEIDPPTRATNIFEYIEQHCVSVHYANTVYIVEHQEGMRISAFN